MEDNSKQLVRDNFAFMASYYEAVQVLCDEDRLLFYESIMRFSLYGEEPKLQGAPKMGFDLVEPILRKQRSAFENGKKGGAPKGNCNNRFSQKVQPKYNQNTTDVQGGVVYGVQPIGKDRKGKEKEIQEKKTQQDAASLSLSLTDFEKQMQENFPRVQSMKTPLTEEQWDKLVESYGAETVKSKLYEMENYTDLHKKNQTAYLTIRNWISRDQTKTKG